jgi:conjugative transposon TraK protein
MLIQSLEQKTRLAMMTVVLAIVGSTALCGFTLYYAFRLVSQERSQIYILDGDIPFLAERSRQEANFVMEAKAHIQLFHQYFFNLPPDDDYIKWSLGKAMYMADATAMKQKQAMEENGFYSDIISSSAVCTIICDSIQMDESTKKFKYFGTQLIKRRSREQKRSIVTVGQLENVPRTSNNPHGLLITHWRTLENKDIDY